MKIPSRPSKTRGALALAAGLALFLDAATLPGQAANEPAARKPNIVVILADDLGYADIGANGGKEIPTPAIDSLARDGIRFTSGYVSGPYCSPTRAGFLTGRYQQRFGHEFNPGRTANDGSDAGLSLKEVTIADRLKAAGYATGLVGKFHQGYVDKFNPVNRGFQEHFGFLSAAHSYTNLTTKAADPIRRGLEVVEEKEYLTDAFTREALAFIERHQREPFFLYLAYNAVHSPLDVHPRYHERFAYITDPKRRRFATLLAALDDGVAAVREKLRATQLENDTLVVFFSDNGGPTSDNTSRNDPLRGFKATTWEGGIRVPFIISWKGKLLAGKVEHRPIIQLDLLPTALAAAGVEVKPEWNLDGVNLLPYLTGANAGLPHQTLYWRFGQQIAIRHGEWKLVKAVTPGQRLVSGTNAVANAKATTDGAELYNLAQDISESKNLASTEPEKVRELAALWNAWNAQLADPAWGPGTRQRQTGDLASRTPVNGPWKSGDELDRDVAPQVAERPLVISAEVDVEGRSGVVVAQGASAHGYAIYLDEGRPAFAVRVSGELAVIAAKEPLARGTHRFEAKLTAGGNLSLSVDGRTVAEGKAPGLIADQPGDGFTVGSDGDAAVGDYAAPNAFAGQVSNVQVKVL